MKKLFSLLILLSCMAFSFEDVTSNYTPGEDLASEQEDVLSKSDQKIIDLDQIQKAFTNKKELPDTVNVYKYNPKEIIKIRTRLFMKSTIILPKGELPIAPIPGDEQTFNIQLLRDLKSKYKLDNVLTVQPTQLGADTNLTILSESGRVYSFYFYSTDPKNEKVPNLINYVTLDGKIPVFGEIANFDEKDKEIQKLKKQIFSLEEKLQISKDEKDIDLTNFNIVGSQFDYVFKKGFKLEAVFNDKQNTYFKFKDGFEVPKVFYKNEINNSIAVPYSIQKNILKVKRLSKDWQLEIDGRFLNIEKKGTFEIKPQSKRWSIDMTRTNFSFYYLKGDDELKPQVVFHDNEFTYFKFDLPSGFKSFPAIFKVIDGYDNPLFHFEVVGSFVVAKSVHRSFTFKLGELFYCIRYDDEN